MKRTDDYFGLFNNAINFNTTLVESWWDYQDPENRKKKIGYDIVKDYYINIKKIIEELLKRPIVKYNSLLISEEKIRANQFLLVDKIVKDFPNLFIIIYHGNCLRLYLSQNYEKEIKRLSMKELRLWQSGGIYGSSIDTEKSEKLPNNYCYFDINTKIFNIKSVYKLLRILFEESDTPILCKTIITITGKYGERGYSFTSDDYDNYSLHLTDQYFVSHASPNCTDISQKLRLQGKYNDLELLNGSMKLTLWTNPKLQDIIQNFYVKFIKKIEKKIMQCENWEDIKELVESIIDNGNLKFSKYMKYIDVSKKRKNLEIIKHYNKKNNGYQLIMIDDMNDEQITEWCKKFNLPEYICINKIKEMNIDEFIDKYGIYKPLIPKKINKNTINISDKKSTLEFVKQLFPKVKKVTNIRPGTENVNRKNGINNYILENKEYNYSRSKQNECIIINYDDEDYYHLVGLTDEKTFPKSTNNYIKNIPYIIDINNNKVKYSVLIKKYREQNNTHEYTNEAEDDFIDDEDDFIEDNNKFPEKYYWKTLDDCLYLYDKDKPEIYSLNIVSPPSIKNDIQPINTDILLFTNSCCKKTNQKNLRFGIKDIFKIYETWCKKNSKKCLKTLKIFKEEFEKINYKEEKSKGVDINNNSGKRGYNIMISL